MVEHQPPHRAGDHRRDDRGEHEERHEEAFEGAVGQKMKCKQHAENQFERQGHGEEQKRAAECRPDPRIGEQLLVVGKPDPICRCGWSR